MQHVHPVVLTLSAQYGVELAPRLVRNGHIFNGKNIACFYAKRISKFGVYPIKAKISPFSDHDLLHEIAHFVVAKPEQRILPEYGLGYVAAPGQGYSKQVVSDQECQAQEFSAQKLCIEWGYKYGISPVMSDSPDPASTWREYEQKKAYEWVQIELAHNI